MRINIRTTSLFILQTPIHPVTTLVFLRSIEKKQFRRPVVYLDTILLNATAKLIEYKNNTNN